VGALFIFYHKAPSPAIVFLPLLALPIILLTLGMGFILALMNGIMRDTGSIITLMMTFLMFLTPILYVKPSSGILAIATDFNPIYYLILSSRELVLTGTLSDPGGFIISACLSALIFMISLIIFHLTETRVAERI
jgi:lipopolysaccharide transport system permease protein